MVRAAAAIGAGRGAQGRRGRGPSPTAAPSLHGERAALLAA